MTSAELSAYLSRIGMAPPPPEALAPSLDLLFRIQRAHRRSIPFENLDIHSGKSIELTQRAVFDKLVVARRGGYCFEHNLLLLEALTALGFAGRSALGRVWLGASAAAPSEVPPRTHAINLIRIGDGEWLADAGFGHGDPPVMRLMQHSVAAPDGTEYQLLQNQDYGWMLLCNGSPQYSFTLDPIWPSDFRLANHYASTSPASRFVNNLIVSTITNDGFASLFNDRLTTSGKSRLVADRDDYRRILRDCFGIELSGEDWSRLKLPFPG